MSWRRRGMAAPIALRCSVLYLVAEVNQADEVKAG